MHEKRQQVIGRAENYRNKSIMICWQGPRDQKLKKDIIIRTKLKFWILNIFVIKKKYRKVASLYCLQMQNIQCKLYFILKWLQKLYIYYLNFRLKYNVSVYGQASWFTEQQMLVQTKTDVINKLVPTIELRCRIW